MDLNIKDEVNQIQMIINSSGSFCPAGFSGNKSHNQCGNRRT